MIHRRLLIGALLGFSSLALADTWTMTYTGSLPAGGWVSGSRANNVNGDGSSGHGINGWAGTIGFDLYDATTNTHYNPYDTVCGDIYHDFPPPSSWGAQLFDSSTYVVTPNVGPGHYIDAMSVVYAGNMVALAGSLAGINNNLGNLDSAQAQGLQLAVWNALYESVSTFNINDASNLQINPSGLSDGSGSEVWWAQYFIAHDTTPGSAVFIRANPESGGQDQFGLNFGGGHHLVTPEPFTMSLGIAAVGLFIRRRTKKS